MNRMLAVLVALCLIVPVGCQTARSAYYNAWESMGYAKRERLVDNVRKAKDEQIEAKQQFTSALEQFKSVVNFSGGDMEKMYNKLNSEYEACEAQAGEVNTKIAAVKNVGTALFSEWKTEIGQIKDDPTLKSSSEQLLAKTQANYNEMITRMDAAAATMQPVLTKFKNRVLFIKHNLNAQAIASLKGTEMELGGQIDTLIKEMEKSIAEADEFIAETQGK